MSEPISTTPAAVSAPAPAPASAASLYPADGGAAAAAAAAGTLAAPADTTTVEGGAGTDTLVAPAGADTLAGGQGTDTVAGTEGATAGTDTVAGEAGADSLSATYNFTLPEGLVADDALTTKAKTVFAAAGVPADQAQGLVNLFGEAMKASSDAQLAAHNTQQQAWINEINSMPEFTGPTRETSNASIGKLFDEFGTPEAKAALNAYGVGNNPALVKMMVKIAQAFNEGAPAGQGRPIGTAGRAPPTTLGGSLYPDGGEGPQRRN